MRGSWLFLSSACVWGRAASLSCSANYEFPPCEASPDVEIDHVWTHIPVHDELITSADYSLWWDMYGQQGYPLAMASLDFAGLPGNGTRGRIRFQTWDSYASRPSGRIEVLSPTCKLISASALCELEYPIQAGVHYTFRFALAGVTSEAAIWNATVLDTSTGTTRLVGTLQFNNVGRFVGFGNLQPRTRVQLSSYGAAVDCEDVNETGMGFIGPYWHGRTVGPTQASRGYGELDCGRSSVESCIPEVGCGSPNLLLRAGKGVVREGEHGTLVWTEETVTMV